MQNEPFSAMLKQREETFRKKQEELLDCIDEGIAARKKELQEAKDPKKEALRGKYTENAVKDVSFVS